jgi:hypothetical protein
VHIFCSKFNKSLNVINVLVSMATMKPLVLAPPRASHHRGGQPNRLILRDIMVHWQSAFVALAET